MSTTDHEFHLSKIRYPRLLEEREGRILSALKSYQIIETILKLYLVRTSKNRKIAAASVLKNHLGKLLEKFDKVNTNKVLQEELKSIKDDRNIVAHQALVLHNSTLSVLLGARELDLTDLKRIDKKATKVMSDLVCEFINQTKPII